MIPESISFATVPHLDAILPTIREAMPEAEVKAVPVNFVTIDHAANLVDALAEHCCVDLFVQGGELHYGPDEFLTQKNLTLLILWRLPIMAALNSGSVREITPDLDNLGKDLDESLYVESLGKAFSLSLLGRQKALARCAVEEGWTDEKRNSMQAFIEEHWPVLSGGSARSGFPEQMLIDLGLKQGTDWSYTLQDGEMQPGLSLPGLLKLVDQCATEQGWTDQARDDYRAEIEEHWPCHGGGHHE